MDASSHDSEASWNATQVFTVQYKYIFETIVKRVCIHIGVMIQYTYMFDVVFDNERSECAYTQVLRYSTHICLMLSSTTSEASVHTHRCYDTVHIYVSFGLRQRAKRVCIHIGVTIQYTYMFDVVFDNERSECAYTQVLRYSTHICFKTQKWRSSGLGFMNVYLQYNTFK